MSCLFCKIANGEIESKLVYADDDVVAFHDIAPQAPTHILCIPRRHISTLNDLDEADAQLSGKLLLTARRLAKELGFAEDGYRVVMNCNGHGGQTVFHIHLHLLGGRALHWPPG
ncbi:MAG: histidine triad nucleotide-binding protein [Gammaproteobacteria bacterium]|nr:histidine triad nucleotide-binding protein [Gammaproteobacteria bacterium]MDH5651923.1 histidine triad nucleotide-binding protein [Gammaproteobacteria bacterium]